MYDRLEVDDSKIDKMILLLKQLVAYSDPIGEELYRFTYENGMEIVNKIVPFGTAMIIYESRSDLAEKVVEIAFKFGNKNLLKGGKEFFNSNIIINGKDKIWACNAVDRVLVSSNFSN